MSGVELIEKARRALEGGRFEDTVSFAGEVLKVDPQNSDAHLLLGLALPQTGRFADAVPHLEIVCRLAPDSFAAAYWLSVSYKKLDKAEEAIEFARRAVSLDPQNWRATEHLGFCYQFALRFVEAEQCFVQAIKSSPVRASLWGGLGLVLQGQGRAHEASDAFRRALTLDPNSFPAHMHLAAALTVERYGEDAVNHARRALELRPNSAEAELTLAGAFVAADKAEEAEEHLTKAMELGASAALVYALSGEIKQMQGDMDEASVQFQKALEIEPAYPRACLGIVSSRRVIESDVPFIEKMEAAAHDPGLTLSGRFNLNFALGKALEDLGRYEEALKHFDDGNYAARTMKFGDTPFDTASLKEETDFSIDLFTGDFIDQHQGEGSELDLPIFVIGMMRSGTTLVEQILSSHPRVEGAGEQSFWTKRIREAFEADRPVLRPGRLKQLAEEYCKHLGKIAPNAGHVVDKMPSNYSVIAPIHLALPESRIIHIRRNPVDTCISMYTTPNSARVDWGHDRENITFAYEEYQRLMGAWRDVIPANRMLEIEYEDLTSDPEPVIRRVIEFCGLEWDDACLRYYETKRSVGTPSVWQVRQPIYRTSVERWRRYEPWLGSFARLLP